MKGLTTALLKRACQIFLDRAYPEGRHTIPTHQHLFLDLAAEESLESVLLPPLCQSLPHREGGLCGYALRLGSARHPHLKLQIVDHDNTDCVFSVDTHDGFSVCATDTEAGRWRELQTANRRLKEEIERAWEEAGLLTFNALLRRHFGLCQNEPRGL